MLAVRLQWSLDSQSNQIWILGTVQWSDVAPSGNEDTRDGTYGNQGFIWGKPRKASYIHSTRPSRHVLAVSAWAINVKWVQGRLELPPHQNAGQEEATGISKEEMVRLGGHSRRSEEKRVRATGPRMYGIKEGASVQREGLENGNRMDHGLIMVVPLRERFEHCQ
ncbi:hypothetical protein K438DRAFT_1782962 [Mycena galopus ATCC 62051]|nr:hypothetical protein K438DRAFT_1782962 [Mycena galopus ATCC 62051]